MELSMIHIVILLGSYASTLQRAAAQGTDIQPNTVYYNEENTSAGSAFEQNLAMVYKFLLHGARPVNNSAAYSYGSYPDNVYGFRKCYKMSETACAQCLKQAKGQISKSAPLSVGARILVNSTEYQCFLRYENYNFVMAPSPAPAPAPVQSSLTTPATTGTPSQSASVHVGIIAGAVLGAFLALCSTLASLV